MQLRSRFLLHFAELRENSLLQIASHVIIFIYLCLFYYTIHLLKVEAVSSLSGVPLGLSGVPGI